MQQGVDPASWENANFVTDLDHWDAESRDSPEIGILVRTDYDNEDAWQTFCGKLRDAEKEFASAVSSEEEPSRRSEDQTSRPDEAMEEDEESSDDEEYSAPIVKILNPASPQDRAPLTAISNLSALRLLNEVDIRAAPTPPAGTKRIKPANRLVDHDGWQEIYTGKTLWIYDAKSNDDQCVRLVSQQGDMYGTATYAYCLSALQSYTECLAIAETVGGLESVIYANYR